MTFPMGMLSVLQERMGVGPSNLGAIPIFVEARFKILSAAPAASIGSIWGGGTEGSS